MALKLALTNLSNGLGFPEAYIKVHSFEAHANSTSATISIFYYKDYEARQAGKEPLNLPLSQNFAFSGEEYTGFFGPNAQYASWQEACYEALKTLEFFWDAVDC